MNADDFRDYMLSFLFLRYLSDNYETAAKKELGKDYPKNGDSPDGGRRSASKIAEAASIVAERRVSSGDDRSVPLAIWYATPSTTMSKWQSEMSYNR